MGHENLIKARKEKGFTQKEMAEMLAMEQTTYSKKERGISRIRENEWIRFSKILDKDIEVLKNEIPQAITDYNVSIYLKIIEIIIKHNKKLEEENTFLKRQLDI